MMKKKRKVDKLLNVAVFDEGDGADYANNQSWPKEMMVSGDLNLGRKGNPVTILIEDEITGESMEINGVRNAFLIVEDSRKKSKGWLSMAIGSLEKMESVLSFLSQTTLEMMRKLTNR